MPRTARIVYPNWPHHLVHRGHNRGPVFFCERDFVVYLANLREIASELECLVYAYCLMNNHVHLIIVPKRSGDLAMLMKRLAGRHTLYLNRRLKRTGTAWEDRFKSNPIVTDLYLLACSRYVDLNPVRAGIVRAPEDYRWSSFRERSGRSPAPWLDEDPAFLALGNSREERERRYDAWVRSTINAVETDEIRTAFERGLTLGTSGPNPSRTRIETDLPFPLHRGRT